MSAPDYEYPRTVFQHNHGWWVMQQAAQEFVLVAQNGQHLATFGTCAAAVDYMNNEFL